MTRSVWAGWRAAFLASIVFVGIAFHGVILFLPPGFNADAATECLRCLDALRGRGGFSFTDFHGYRVYLHSLLPLWLPFASLGPQVFPVRLLLLLYDLLAVWGVWRLGALWLPKGGERFALLFALFSPWLAEPFSVTVATTAAFPAAGIALAEDGDKKRVFWGHLLLGLSFYGYHTARVGAAVYLLLFICLRRRELKQRAIPFFVTALLILPTAVMGTAFPSYRKLFVFPREPASISLALERLKDGFLSWGPDGIVCGGIFLAAFVGILLWSYGGLRAQRGAFSLLWILITGTSMLGAVWMAPYLRPRIVLHAAPAVLLACAYLAVYLSKRWPVLSWVLTGALCIHGAVLHVWRMGWHRSIERGGWDHGVCAAHELLKKEDADWIHVDCRMDDQLLFLSDRSLPMDDAVFPRTGGATYPWLGYAAKDGVSLYCFWADSPEKNPFRELFPRSKAQCVVRGWRGGRAVEIYRVDHTWTPFQRHVLERAGRMALNQEADFWRKENDLWKAASLYEQILERYPESQDAPSAGLKAGLCFLQGGRIDAGLKILHSVAKRYPETQEAATASKILDKM